MNLYIEDNDFSYSGTPTVCGLPEIQKPQVLLQDLKGGGLGGDWWEKCPHVLALPFISA